MFISDPDTENSEKLGKTNYILLEIGLYPVVDLYHFIYVYFVPVVDDY